MRNRLILTIVLLLCSVASLSQTPPGVVPKPNEYLDISFRYNSTTRGHLTSLKAGSLVLGYQKGELSRNITTKMDGFNGTYSYSFDKHVKFDSSFINLGGGNNCSPLTSLSTLAYSNRNLGFSVTNGIISKKESLTIKGFIKSDDTDISFTSLLNDYSVFEEGELKLKIKY
jgi:hypothetical protein